jgi:hypothetical protein
MKGYRHPRSMSHAEPRSALATIPGNVAQPSKSERMCAVNASVPTRGPCPHDRPKGLATFLALVIFGSAGCAPTNHYVLLNAMRERFRFYECVPLGWEPVQFAGGYYQGYTAEAQQLGWWVPARWVAQVRMKRIESPDERSVVDVIEALARHGMVSRSNDHGIATYYLTWQSLPYFYDDDDYGNNPERYPYLCSRDVQPTRVAWTRSLGGGAAPGSFQAAIDWRRGPRAPWAEDPVIRAHSVIIGPTRNPFIVDVLSDGDEWRIDYSPDWPLPHIRVVDESAWPRPPR